jgi:plasmid stabilization system protein ParE
VKIRFLPLAKQELLGEARYYDAEVRGLGDAFLDEVEKTLNLIKEYPEASPLYDKTGARRRLMSRFPIAIVYVVESDTAYVIAVAHAKRRPGYWQRRKRAP